jgi:glycosyltransferase involved in cell wall biosynthesis
MNRHTADISVSIAVCVIDGRSCIRLLGSLLEYVPGDQVVIIVDGPAVPGLGRLQSYCRGKQHVDLFINDSNRGLSFCRNVAMERAAHDYLIFFDDDVVLKRDVVVMYKEGFASGYDILGGPLRLPDVYPPLPPWLPRGLTSLLGIHSSQQKIWGGNFGFNLCRARDLDLGFQDNLGRRGKQLLAGDETTFTRQMLAQGSRQRFNEAMAVEHHIDPRRYRLGYLSRRAYWQGRCEVRRRAALAGIKKELQRAYSPGIRRGWARALAPLAGTYLFASFLSGIVVETLWPQLGSRG